MSRSIGDLADGRAEDAAQAASVFTSGQAVASGESLSPGLALAPRGQGIASSDLRDSRGGGDASCSVVEHWRDAAGQNS